jgi:glycosyltransferase involved in cell wall biosynthesis
MAATGGVSVIVRARDEAETLARCLAVLGAQQGVGEVEVIVVDGGSRDTTAELARSRGAIVLNPAPGRFSFGGALNRGAERARGEILVALSAHALPSDPGWLARVRAAFDDPAVAWAAGDRYGPDGAPLRAAIAQDTALWRRRPEWGYSNAAGAFRAELWRARGFRADLPACEDKEWALYWLQRGYVGVVDPALAVEHDHTHDSLRSIFARARREAEGLACFLERPARGPRELAREWWSDLRWYDSAARARLSPRRSARLLGEYAGRRRPGRPGPGGPGEAGRPR